MQIAASLPVPESSPLRHFLFPYVDSLAPASGSPPGDRQPDQREGIPAQQNRSKAVIPSGKNAWSFKYFTRFSDHRRVRGEISDRGAYFPCFTDSLYENEDSGQRESNPHGQLGRLELYH
jgi:hypothetical protein